MKSQGASSPPPPPQHLHRAAGPSSSPGNGFVPAVSPLAPLWPWVSSILGTSRRHPAHHLASPRTCFSSPTSCARLLRPGQHLSCVLTVTVPTERNESGGLRRGMDGARTPRSGAQRRRVIRALWGRSDAGQEGCGQEQREAAGSPQAAPPWQPGPGDGGMEGGGCGRRRRRRRKEGG